MIRLLTHSDLDGVGCRVIMEARFGVRNVFTKHLDNKEVDDAVLNIIEQKTEDNVYITDICPSREVFDKLVESEIDFAIFDHHKTSEWLGDFTAEENNRARARSHHSKDKCATLLLYDTFSKAERIPQSDALRSFAETVNAHDLWKEHSPYWRLAQDMNRVVWALGFDMFSEVFYEDPTAHMKYPWNRLAHAAKQREDAQIEAKSEDGVFDKNHLVLVANSKASQIGNTILKQFPSVAYVAMANTERNVVELRSRQGGFDVSALAKENGGGGHQAAAGFPLDFKNLLVAAVKEKLP